MHASRWATPEAMSEAKSETKKATPIKKGSLVRVVSEEIQASVELTASDARLPPYIFETDGEVLDIRGDYAWVKFAIPVPNIWFRLDHLKAA